MTGFQTAVARTEAGMLRHAVCVLTIAATLPYLILKLLWLFGHPVGASGAAGSAELLDPRHLVGDVVTAGMEVAAVVLALALVRPWGARVPVVLLAGPIWVAAGLLAQGLAGGAAVPGGNGLHDWVYACVYGGFVLQAIGLMAGFAGHARERWAGAARRPVAAATPAVWWLSRCAVPVAAGYAAAMVAWATGAASGPRGFDTVAQRSFLAVTGLLVLAGAVAVPLLVRRRGGVRPVAAVAMAFVGTAVAVASGPAGIALSNHGRVGAAYAAVSLAGGAAGLVLAGGAVRSVRAGTAAGPGRRRTAR